MAFTYDVTTNRGRVRLRLSDTTSTAYWFEDDEIDEFLSTGGSVDGAIRLGCQTLLMSRSLRAKKFTLSGMSYDDTATVAALRDVLATLGGDMPTLTVSIPSAVPMDDDWCEPTTTSCGC